MKLSTSLKSILVFQNGELLKQICYNTKKQAIGNYRLFTKHGMLDEYGEQLNNLTFELL